MDPRKTLIWWHYYNKHEEGKDEEFFEELYTFLFQHPFLIVQLIARLLTVKRWRQLMRDQILADEKVSEVLERKVQENRR